MVCVLVVISPDVLLHLYALVGLHGGHIRGFLLWMGRVGALVGLHGGHIRGFLLWMGRVGGFLIALDNGPFVFISKWIK